MAVIDLFSEQSDRYAAARPTYPRSLYHYLATIVPQTHRAWDCATGNGQAAIGLAEFFDEVQATDASPQQIAQAMSHPKIHYGVQVAEATNFPDRWFDVVVVAQALHWFDYDRFWPEVRRVLQPQGIFAAWAYGQFTIEPAIDAIIQTNILEIIAPYWSPRVQYLLNDYQDVGCPFEPVPSPDIAMNMRWNLLELLAYLQTWSALRQCIQAQGSTFFDEAVTQLVPAWGDASQAKTIAMTFHCLVGRAEGTAL